MFSFSSMVIHMFAQVVFMHKSFAANFADMRSFSSMLGHDMGVQVPDLIEFGFALVTFELFAFIMDD